MEKKESYRHILPHFQQPGQAYFVTWSLKDAVPPKALKRYTQKLEMLKSQLGGANSLPVRQAGDSPVQQAGDSPDKKRELEFAAPREKLQQEYYSVRKKYIKAYDDLLDSLSNPVIDLSKPENTEILIKTFQFWEGNKVENFAFCIMPNHVHWVFSLFEKDKDQQPVYLQDILYSVKRFSANAINELENRNGTLWQKQSFDTTIRDEKHLYFAIEYTLNNPVSAGLVKERRDWKGCWSKE